MRLAAARELILEPVGSDWALFDEATGETHLLNDESVLILELLRERALDDTDVAAAVAAELGVGAESIAASVRQACDALMAAGLLVVQ